ncbi:hypothetical protein [Leifsonia poae]|nr:hypothetical protein [Leifsonia poae]
MSTGRPDKRSPRSPWVLRVIVVAAVLVIVIGLIVAAVSGARIF